MPPTVVMDADRIGRTLTRIAHEIVERNKGVEDLALVGVRTRGVPIARRVARALKEITGDEIPEFAEITATTTSALRQSRLLASRQASLSQFFSPVVLEALSGQDADEALAPREADVTVLFCDLRGFTATSERAAGDLFDLLQRVSRALGVMTRQILDEGGVVGDFHGDAAMGFWGWPLPQADAVLFCVAAVIRSRCAIRPHLSLVRPM